MILLVNVTDWSATGDTMRSLHYEEFKQAWVESLATAADVCKLYLHKKISFI